MIHTKVTEKNRDICPYTPWTLTMLDNVVRKFLQNPEKMLGGYIRKGMSVIDIGCGPGFFTLAMANMVGSEGQVIAVDVQKEMLDLVQKKSKRQGLDSRIRFHQAKPDTIGLSTKADFILSFYMVHEVPDRDNFFREVVNLLSPDGRFLVVEPVFHVSYDGFEDTLVCAQKAGFKVEERPKISMSRAAVLVRA